jgi:hypothetical protein
VQLNRLTDDELLRRAYIAFGGLTRTNLEIELLRRLEIASENEPLLKVLESHGLDDPAALDKHLAAAADLPSNVHELLDALAEHDIDDPEVLRKQLDRITKFDQAMQDLAEPLATLQTLATTE